MDSAIMAANEKMKVVVSDDVDDDNYWKRVMARMDERGRITYAHDEGFSEGIEQRSIEIAQKMKEMGLSTEQIAMGTGLSQEAIEEL